MSRIPESHNHFIETCSQSAYALQCKINAYQPSTILVSRVFIGTMIAITDTLIDTIKAPLQCLEHSKNAVVQLILSSEQCNFDPITSEWENSPSPYSIKGSIHYTECAISYAIFTIPTTLLGLAKLVHQLGAHFFYEDGTYSIGLAKAETDSPPAWDAISKNWGRKKCTQWQDGLYTWTRSFSEDPKSPDIITPRILSPLIALVDVTLDTAAPLTATIEVVCRAVGHLFGVLSRQKNCSLRDAIVHTDLVFFTTSQTLAAILMATHKFLQKTSAILYNPGEAYSIRAFSNPENIQSSITFDFNREQSDSTMKYI